MEFPSYFHELQVQFSTPPCACAAEKQVLDATMLPLVEVGKLNFVVPFKSSGGALGGVDKWLSISVMGSQAVKVRIVN